MPLYHVIIPCGQDLACFSRRYNGVADPVSDFVGLMTCAQVDADCPIIPGATARFDPDYLDPKEADDTSMESACCDELCLPIAAEMLYGFD